MKIRKLLRHRARLSHEKPWGYMRKAGALVTWNMRGWRK